MEGELNIENWKTKIGTIKIQPILDINLLEEELSLTLDIYEEDNNEEFDFNLCHIKIQKEVHFEDSYNGEFEISEAAIGLNEIWYYGDEFTIKELKLNFISEKGTLIGRGKAANENKEITFKFSGEYKINNLETWKLDNNVKKERQAKNPKNLIDVLEHLASEKDCQSYKNSVPFVHIPYEFISKWESSYQPKQKWFDEIYDTKEKIELENFDNLLNQLNQNYKNDLPDVPEIFTSIEWQEIMKEANRLATEIKIVWNIKS
jgi:hypothetical protein